MGCRSVALTETAGDSRFATAPGITNAESAKISDFVSSVGRIGIAEVGRGVHQAESV